MAVSIVIFGILAAAIAFLCARAAVNAIDPPRAKRDVVQAATMGALAGLAPLCAVIFLRLSLKACVVANLLGLPWAEPWREIAHWGTGAIWLGSTVLLIVALALPRLRLAGIAMLKWSIIVVVPTFFLYVLLIFGDPEAGCIPV